MEKLKIQDIPAILYGEPSDRLFLFIHGKNGSKEEGEQFASVACGNGYQVLSFDLPEHGERKHETDTFNPWHASEELKCIMTYARKTWPHISVRANSIGAYFAMLSFAGEALDRCLFVSPILDMEQLIGNMMLWSGVTKDRLKSEKIIPTAFGETLSWEYLSYVRQHRITKWNSPTSILYGTADNMTDRKTVDAFVERFGCKLTVMEGGEHWFHTPEQLEVLEKWEREAVDITSP
jgi:alpha-beta hydrolase superfamily lysophospholipase